MRVPFTPFTRGVQRQIDDVAQQTGGLRDVMNLLIDVTGRLDGMYIGGVASKFTGTMNRIHQWGTKTLGLKSNPETTIQLGDTSTVVIGPTGNGRATSYNNHVPLAIENGQAQILTDNTATDPFATNTAYIGVDAGDGWGIINTTSYTAPTTTVTFVTTLPQIPSGKTPQYIVFDRDGDIGSTSAEIRPITSYTDGGSGITTLDYTGLDAPTDSVYAFIIYGTSATDTFKPEGFATYRKRLTAHKDNKVYFSGFIGQASPFIEPQELNDFYWYELNTVTVGHESQGKIVKCIPLNDALIVFLERATYRIYGYPPINGALDNQLVVQEISSNLGIDSYDAAALTTDGKAIFLIGNDQNLYAFASDFVQIDQPVREHPRFKNLTIVNCTDKYAIFTGITVEPESVPTEIYPKDGGYLYQGTPAFAFHLSKQEYTIFDPIITDSGNNFIPLNDPEVTGIFSTFNVSGRDEISIATPTGINIVNDPSVRSPSLQDFFVCGLATHQVPIDGNLFMVNQIDVNVEATELKRLSVVSPAENPAGNAPVSIARANPQSEFGITSRYGIFFSEPDMHNYVSVAVGYWGEKLLGGLSDWVAAPTALPLVSSVYLSPFSVTGLVDRIDVLMSDISGDCTIYIYGDDNGTPDTSDVVFYNTVREPSTGFVDSANKYWRPCDIRVNLDGDYWIGIAGNGNGTAYRVPSNNDLYLDEVLDTSNTAIALRVIQEAGNPFAARSILSVAAIGQAYTNPW